MIMDTEKKKKSFRKEKDSKSFSRKESNTTRHTGSKRHAQSDENRKNRYKRSDENANESDVSTEKQKHTFSKKRVPARQSEEKKYSDRGSKRHNTEKSDFPEKKSFRKQSDDKEGNKSFRHSSNERSQTGRSDFSERRKSRRFADDSADDKSFKERGEYSDKRLTKKSPYSKKKQLEFEKKNYSKNELTRLNKYIANAGICSRREADDYIKSGIVKVNGIVVTEMGHKVSLTDVITFGDKILKQERKVYILLNKPKDYITTTDDPHAKRTVMELIDGACSERVYPVGRLDRNTTGVLLLTNDGDLAKKLTHPKYNKKKIYHAHLDKPIQKPDMQKLVDGVELEFGFVNADSISYADEVGKREVGIEIHSGQNHVVKLMFESIGYKVIKLDRVYFAGLTKKNLPRGHWRFLTDKEIGILQMGAYE